MMSRASDFFEYSIVRMVNQHRGETLPYRLPEWLLREGVIPGARILYADGIGSKDHTNKTDVIIYLSEGSPIKISAKLMNADHFGNWYGHTRFLQEFGMEAFSRMTHAATVFANNWARIATVPYVGVSICFGRRPGRTGQDFTDIFTTQDILTVTRGYGVGNSVANCMYIADVVASSILELIDSLEEITPETVNAATESFKVAYRPVNPMTEGTNRGKCVYTRFCPYHRLSHPTIITTPEELFRLGSFVPVEPNRINHNHILNDLRDNYNIVVPRKPR